MDIPNYLMKGGNKMNKKELIDKVAEETGYHKKEIKDVVESVLATVSKSLAKDEKVQLVGFGTFEVVKRAAREGRNPQTGVPCNPQSAKAGSMPI
jgi:DNA-binding protein HU-beta